MDILGINGRANKKPTLHKDMIPHFHQMEIRKSIVCSAIEAGHNYETAKKFATELESFCMEPFNTLMKMAEGDKSTAQ